MRPQKAATYKTAMQFSRATINNKKKISQELRQKTAAEWNCALSRMRDHVAHKNSAAKT